jgi:hypothetical protein
MKTKSLLLLNSTLLLLLYGMIWVASNYPVYLEAFYSNSIYPLLFEVRSLYFNLFPFSLRVYNLCGYFLVYNILNQNNELEQLFFKSFKICHRNLIAIALVSIVMGIELLSSTNFLKKRIETIFRRIS